MIISRTPFRISFLGGGTDLPDFYNEEEGAVISTAINKYMYITVNDRFDSTYRLSYSKTEIRDSIEQIEHPIFRVALEKYATQGILKGKGLELISMADVPAGTGLGSSSSFTVGLLHALKVYQQKMQVSSGSLNNLAEKMTEKVAEELAREASQIEIEILKEPIGKQDQYAAAYGGLKFIRFHTDGKVSVEPVKCSSNQLKKLELSCMMFYTGMTRSASQILTEQKNKTASKRDTLHAMKNLAFEFKKSLESEKSIQHLGEILHQGWLLKKTMTSGISDSKIDSWYDRARQAGACGGKILGAGGGGFLMVFCESSKQIAVEKELKELRRIPIQFENNGSSIIFGG